MLANIVIDASNAALYEAPEALDGVRMRVANDVDLLAVPDAVVRVLIPMVAKIVVDA